MNQQGVVVDAPEGTVQTTAFEIEDNVIRALYVGRSPDKLRHLGFRNELEAGPGGKQIQIEGPDGNPIELFEPARS